MGLTIGDIKELQLKYDLSDDDQIVNTSEDGDISWFIHVNIMALAKDETSDGKRHSLITLQSLEEMCSDDDRDAAKKLTVSLEGNWKDHKVYSCDV